MNHPDALSEKRVWIPKHKKSKKPFKHELLNNLYINADIKLVEPRSIERSVGKAVRVIDKRSL